MARDHFINMKGGKDHPVEPRSLSHLWVKYWYQLEFYGAV